MTVAQDVSPDVLCARPARSTSGTLRIGLLGLGHVGSAVARLALARPSRSGCDIDVTAALVRDPQRRRGIHGVTVTTDAERVFATRPSVVVEVLGGIEPARTLVLEALRRGLPVVTANKSLVAHHGDELLDAAARAGVALRYEASVIAGVPFLGTFARRPHASALSSLSGIVNGTTNFILSQMHGGTTAYDSALVEAQRRGFAEPDPAKDVGGVDAVEKLAILIRQFTGRRVSPADIETTGIAHITAADLRDARELGGVLKPVVLAQGLDLGAEAIAAFAGPALVPASHPLAHVSLASNALRVRDIAGSELCFTGPGAGPDVTAITVLDDVVEAVSVREGPRGHSHSNDSRDGGVVPPTTAWFLRVESDARLPPGAEIVELLGSHGVWAERSTVRDWRDGRGSHALLTYPCARPRIERAAAALAAATGSTTRLFRALEPLV